MTHMIQYLSFFFDIKELDYFHYFLGLHIDIFSTSLFVTKLSMDWIFYQIQDARLQTLQSRYDSPLLFDPLSYGSTVGAFQCLTKTRPNVSFVVQQTC